MVGVVENLKITKIHFKQSGVAYKYFIALRLPHKTRRTL